MNIAVDKIRHIVSDTNDDIHIPSDPNNEVIAKSDAVITSNPLPTETIIEYTGFSIAV